MTVQLSDSSSAVLPADCVILAAGLSSRMGQWKMLLPLVSSPGKGEPQSILDCSIANALSACERVILVTGFRGGELEERYRADKRISIIHNPQFETGMKSSLLRGLSEVETDFAFITHGDLPFLSPSLFQAIWKVRCDRSVFPVYKNQHGHPVLVTKKVIKTLINCNPEGSIRSLLRSHCFDLDVKSRNILRDIDTPESYARETHFNVG